MICLKLKLNEPKLISYLKSNSNESKVSQRKSSRGGCEEKQKELLERGDLIKEEKKITSQRTHLDGLRSHMTKKNTTFWSSQEWDRFMPIWAKSGVELLTHAGLPNVKSWLHMGPKICGTFWWVPHVTCTLPKGVYVQCLMAFGLRCTLSNA
ncbi:hypothetical protein DFH28DRAFT_107735 [Melampsora americana]|nr:hypothetical protein DFH28DRAFT_107735 [Melampsora americana]